MYIEKVCNSIYCVNVKVNDYSVLFCSHPYDSIHLLANYTRAVKHLCILIKDIF